MRWKKDYLSQSAAERADKTAQLAAKSHRAGGLLALQEEKKSASRV